LSRLVDRGEVAGGLALIPGGLRLRGEHMYSISMIVLLLILVWCWDLALPGLSLVYHWMTAELLSWGASGGSIGGAVSAIAVFGLGSFGSVLQPLIFVAITFLFERLTTKVEREPKDYLTAGFVQVIFLVLARQAFELTGKLVPVPDAPLISLPDGGRLFGETAVTILELLIFLIATDFLHYWSHRAHHKFAFLWKFHAVHHSPTDLDALHNFLHPVELWVRYFVVVVPLAMVSSLDSANFYLFYAFLVVQNQLTHMNVPVNFGPLGKIIVDNRYHFVHHSSDPADFDRNFAPIFTICDRLFGTYKAPSDGPLPKTGFAAPESPRRLRDYLLARVQ
jgi:sterol desaturase/sphingolipid hydroxylase (fatty acid hydroxylase superfamily)